MKNRIVIFFLAIEVLLCFLFGAQSLRYWVHPLKWGWPSEIKQRGLILIVFVISMLLLNVLLIKKPKIEVISKTILLFCLFILTLIFGVFTTLYLPKPPTVDEILALEQYSSQDVSKLTVCERVRKFAAVGSQRLDLGNRTVLVPLWVHQSLEDIPRDMLLECFLAEISEQESLVDISNGYNEDATRKLHSLFFEAIRLNIVNDPEMMKRLRTIICDKNLDYFGELAIEYFIAKNDNLPMYDYYSDTGKVKLRGEICGDQD